MQDWQRSNPSSIDRTLQRSLALPGGGWVVVARSTDVGRTAVVHRLTGQDFVVWRTRQGNVVVGRDGCPHMGASFDRAQVVGDCAVCPWHGLRVGPEGHPAFAATMAPTHDDGYLVWARLDERLSEAPSDTPHVSQRPSTGIGVVVSTVAQCEPRDVLANRLDPWHAKWFHSYAFSDIRIVSDTPEALSAEVSYRIRGRYLARVIAEFTTPDPRTITMTITEGEGQGSVVETHATPIDDTTTAIIELTIATSDRSGFVYAQRLAPIIKPILAARQQRLWRDDAAYAERLYRVRTSASLTDKPTKKSRSK